MPTKKEKYQETDCRPELTATQQELLRKFILRFLPSTGEKRRYPNNSLPQVHRALNTVFLNQAGFGLSERDVIDALLRMNYGFRTILKPWSDLKSPSTVGFFEQVYQENEQLRKSKARGIKEHSIHTSVSAKDVRDIYLSQKRLPLESANEEKTIDPRIQLKVEIKRFFGLSPHLEIEEFLPKYKLNQLNKKTGI